MEGIMEGIFGWFKSSFSSSGSESLETAMVNLQTVPNPDLAAPWFQNLWVINLAFALLLAFVALLINAVMAARHGNLYGILAAVIDFMKTVVVGYLLLIVLYGLMYAVDVAADAIVLVTTGTSDPGWYTTIITAKNEADPQGSFVLSGMSWVFGMLLAFESFAILQSMYVFSLLFVLTFTFYKNSVGNQFFRWTKAALITVILSKLLIIAVLAIFSRVLLATAATGMGALGGVAFAMFIAAVIPLVTFFSLALHKKQSVTVEGGNVTTNPTTGAVVSSTPPVVSSPPVKEMASIRQKAASVESKAKKVAIMSTGINTSAKLAGPKIIAVATSAHPAAGAAAAAIVGGTIVVTDKVSTNAVKTAKSAERTAVAGGYIDGARSWNRNRKSRKSER